MATCLCSPKFDMFFLDPRSDQTIVDTGTQTHREHTKDFECRFIIILLLIIGSLWSIYISNLSTCSFLWTRTDLHHMDSFDKLCQFLADSHLFSITHLHNLIILFNLGRKQVSVLGFMPTILFYEQNRFVLETHYSQPNSR